MLNENSGPNTENRMDEVENCIEQILLRDVERRRIYFESWCFGVYLNASTKYKKKYRPVFRLSYGKSR